MFRPKFNKFAAIYYVVGSGSKATHLRSDPDPNPVQHCKGVGSLRQSNSIITIMDITVIKDILDIPSICPGHHGLHGFHSFRPSLMPQYVGYITDITDITVRASWKLQIRSPVTHNTGHHGHPRDITNQSITMGLGGEGVK
jgi:hypothetical protein